MANIIIPAELELELKHIREHCKKQIINYKKPYHKEPSLADTINCITYEHRVLHSIQYKLMKIIEQTRKIEGEQVNKQELLIKLEDVMRDDNNIIII